MAQDNRVFFCTSIGDESCEEEVFIVFETDTVELLKTESEDDTLPKGRSTAVDLR